MNFGLQRYLFSPELHHQTTFLSFDLSNHFSNNLNIGQLIHSTSGFNKTITTNGFPPSTNGVMEAISCHRL